MNARRPLLLGRTSLAWCIAAVAATVTWSGCARRTPATVTTPQPPPSTSAQDPGSSAVPTGRSGAPTGTESRTTPPVVALAEDVLSGANLEDLNRNSPLRPAFFLLDSSELDAAARAAVAANAEVLRQNPRWSITIEGHCDERGTAEYNLALGERRALAASAYLQSLGVAASRVKTVSYGDESPFDPRHTEDGWASNRRAHFVISAK
jgi:peptidoglycan-associated lipoprotein